MSELAALLQHIRRALSDLQTLVPQTDDRYRSLPLCFIDAVYSIGVRYESKERTIDDFCSWAGWNCVEEYTSRSSLTSWRVLSTIGTDWRRRCSEIVSARPPGRAFSKRKRFTISPPNFGDARSTRYPIWLRLMPRSVFHPESQRFEDSRAEGVPESLSETLSARPVRGWVCSRK
jgi:hypothetical protein